MIYQIEVYKALAIADRPFREYASNADGQSRRVTHLSNVIGVQDSVALQDVSANMTELAK